MFTLGFFCLFIGFILFVMFMIAIGSRPSAQAVPPPQPEKTVESADTKPDAEN